MSRHHRQTAVGWHPPHRSHHVSLSSGTIGSGAKLPGRRDPHRRFPSFMKLFNVILGLACLLSLVVAAALYFSASGSTRLLTKMQQIRPGSTQQEVRDIMGREPQVAVANQVPGWIEDVVPNNETGEYWYYFMGYPPRNLIIYFDENGHVVFTTWAPT